LKKGFITFAAAMIIAIFAVLSYAESKEVTGVVKTISAEKVVITDEGGSDLEFAITEETAVSQDIEAGSNVTVEAEDGKALFIEALEE